MKRKFRVFYSARNFLSAEIILSFRSEIPGFWILNLAAFFNLKKNQGNTNQIIKIADQNRIFGLVLSIVKELFL